MYEQNRKPVLTFFYGKCSECVAMDAPFQVPTGMFNLLTIGQRGVGKTVFLAGSYAEMHSDGPGEGVPLWFDCKDGRSQQNVEKILAYVERTGGYPPATMRVTSFDFSLKRKAMFRPATVCHFRMRDLPGEMCHLADLNFRDLVFGSHGCCVCIDGKALIDNDDYVQDLKDIFNQVLVIASLTHWNQLKYAFALVVTKCDLLTGGTDLVNAEIQRQIIERLQPLTVHLETFKVNYEIYTSAIPLAQADGVVRLQAAGSAAPLLWLVEELNRAYNPGFAGQLATWLRRFLPTRSGSAPPRGLTAAKTALYSDPL